MTPTAFLRSQRRRPVVRLRGPFRVVEAVLPSAPAPGSALRWSTTAWWPGSPCSGWPGSTWPRWACLTMNLAISSCVKLRTATDSPLLRREPSRDPWQTDRAAYLTDSQGRLVRIGKTNRFRHTAATNLLNAGVPLHVVMRYFGHVTPEMTRGHPGADSRARVPALQKNHDRWPSSANGGRRPLRPPTDRSARGPAAAERLVHAATQAIGATRDS